MISSGNLSAKIEKIQCLVYRYWDVILVALISTAILFYNLNGWRGVTVEEWQFYRDFTTNWFRSRRIHSFFIPSYILAYFVPSRDFMVLRHFTALLTSFGVVLYYLAIKHASSSRIAGFVATALILTDAWILWYGRHFAWIWSAMGLSGLAFYLFFKYREKSVYPNSVINAIGILNFSQTVFFAFPFLSAQFYSLRKKINLKTVIIASSIFFLLVIPSISIFLEKQEGHLAIQESPNHQVDEFLKFSTEYQLPGIGQKTFSVVVNPFNAFSELRKRVGIPTYGLYHFDWPDSKKDKYTILSLALLIFPIYFRIFSDWEHKDFFVIGSLSAFGFLIVFPFLTDESYLWNFLLFLYPLLAMGFCEDKWHVKIVAVILTVSLIFLQGHTAYNQVLNYDYQEEYDKNIGSHIRGKEIIVTRRSHGMLTNSDMEMLKNTSYEIKSCETLKKENYDKMKLVSDACPLQKQKHLGGVRWLKLTR